MIPIVKNLGKLTICKTRFPGDRIYQTFCNLKAAVTEYDELDAQVKKMVEGREKVLAGNWYISGKWMDRKSYDIPADLKAQYEKITKYWRRTVRRVA